MNVWIVKSSPQQASEEYIIKVYDNEQAAKLHVNKFKKYTNKI